MPLPLTPKQAAFCRAYQQTGNASEAYRRAYDAEKMKPGSIRRKAAEVLKHRSVAAELERLNQQTKREHGVTIESLLRELEEARQLALANGQASAAVTATMGKGKLAGVFNGKPDDDVAPPSKIDVTIRRARGEES